MEIKSLVGAQLQGLPCRVLTLRLARAVDPATLFPLERGEWMRCERFGAAAFSTLCSRDRQMGAECRVFVARLSAIAFYITRMRGYLFEGGWNGVVASVNLR